MKLFGSITELFRIILRKDTRAITVRPSQTVTYTADRDVQLPPENADSVLVSESASQTLTNKTIDGDNNTVQDVGISSLKTVLADADKAIVRDASGAVVSAKIADANVSATAGIAATKIGAGTVDNTELGYLDGVTSAIQTQLNGKEPTITGAATTITSANLTASVALQSDASGKVAPSSVTSTELGRLSGVTSAIQTQLDNKVDENAPITGATKTKITYDSKGLVTAGADISNTDMPEDIARSKLAPGSNNHVIINDGTGEITSEAQLAISRGGTGQSTANAALNALLPTQSGNTNKFLKTDGSNTTWASAGGGVGKNYLQDQYDADSPITVQQSVGDVLASSTRSNPGNFGSSTNADLISVSTDSSLRGTSNYLIQFTANAQFIETPLFTLDGSDLGKALSVQFDVTGVGTDNDVQVYAVRYNSSNVLQERILVAGNASSTTPFSAKLPTGTKTFNGFFIPSSTASDKYALRILRNANNTSMRIDALVVGPQQVLQGAIVTDLQTSETPSGGWWTTGPTNVTVSVQHRRIGQYAEIWYRVQATGTSAAFAELQPKLPSGMTLDTAKLLGSISNVASSAPRVPIGRIELSKVGVNSATGIVYYQPGTNTLNCRFIPASTLAPSAIDDASPMAWNTTTNPMTAAFCIIVPIVEFDSANTQQAARAVEEYAYNTGAWDSDDSVSFAYGPQGQQITTSTNLTTQREKRVRFQTPILPTDKIEIEIQRNGNWVPAVGSVLTGDWPIYSFGFGASAIKANSVGIGWQPISGSTTDVLIVFGKYSSLYNGATGVEWSSSVSTSTIKWRVKKVSAGAAVGFPIAPANITLIDSSDNYGGNTKLGLMTYAHGTSYNGGNSPTITLSSGGGTLSSVRHSEFIPYQMANGTWRMKFNLNVSLSVTTRTSAVLAINGVTFKNIASNLQTVSGLQDAGSYLQAAYVNPNTNTVRLDHTSGNTNTYAFSGDVALESKPTWAY